MRELFVNLVGWTLGITIFGLLFWYLFPVFLILGGFAALDTSFGYMNADYRIDREADRGVTFVSTDERYTKMH